ncbi:unnamed protein product, partial [Urochloa humidicola]
TLIYSLLSLSGTAGSARPAVAARGSVAAAHQEGADRDGRRRSGWPVQLVTLL